MKRERMEEFLVDDIAMDIFSHLKESNQGEINYNNNRVQFKVESRRANGEPGDVYLEIFDEEGYRVDIFHVKFGVDNFTGYIVKEDEY